MFIIKFMLYITVKHFSAPDSICINMLLLMFAAVVTSCDGKRL